MRKIKFGLLFALIVLASVLMFTACGKDDVYTVELDETSLSLDFEETFQLNATIKLNDEVTDVTPTWSTSNAAVATVENGLVTAVSEGIAKITVSYEDVFAECTVTVTVDTDSITFSVPEAVDVECNENFDIPVILARTEKGTEFTSQIEVKDAFGDLVDVQDNILKVTILDGYTITYTAVVGGKKISKPMQLNVTIPSSIVYDLSIMRPDANQGPVLIGTAYSDGGGDDSVKTEYDNDKKAIKAFALKESVTTLRLQYQWFNDYPFINEGEKITWVVEVDKGDATGDTITFGLYGFDADWTMGQSGEDQICSFENGEYTVSATSAFSYIRHYLGIDLSGISNKTSAVFYIKKIEIEPNSETEKESLLLDGSPRGIKTDKAFTHGANGDYTLLERDGTRNAIKVTLNSDDEAIINSATILEVPINWYESTPFIDGGKRVTWIIEVKTDEPTETKVAFMFASTHRVGENWTSSENIAYAMPYTSNNGIYTASAITIGDTNRFRLLIDISNLTNKTDAVFYIRSVVVDK